MEEKRITFQIKTIGHLIKREFDNSATKKHADNLTGTHGWIIGYLYHNRDKNIYQKDLEEKFSIRRATVSGIIKLMEKNGLIEKIGDETDKRLKKLVLTQKAIDIHNSVMEDLKKIEEQLQKGLSQEEIDNFFLVIEKMKKNMEE